MKKTKRIFTRLTLRLSLWEYRDIEQLKKETFSATSSKAIIKAATNYLRLKQIIYELQNEIDILRHENNQKQR